MFPVKVHPFGGVFLNVEFIFSAVFRQSNLFRHPLQFPGIPPPYDRKLLVVRKIHFRAACLWIQTNAPRSADFRLRAPA